MSSFVKLRKENTVEINGVRTSIRNGKITSTGSDSLDFVIGGGIEVSSLVLIGKKAGVMVLRSLCQHFLGEDKYGRHSNVLSKLYLADGFHNKHKIYFVNFDDDPRKLVSLNFMRFKPTFSQNEYFRSQRSLPDQSSRKKQHPIPMIRMI